MSENAKPSYHRCHAGGINIIMASALDIAMADGRAILSLESPNNDIRIAIEVNGCPMCLEPLTPLGRTLDRMKRLEGLK